MEKTLNFSVSPPPINYEIVIGQRLIEQAVQHTKILYPQLLVVCTDAVAHCVSSIQEEILQLPSGEAIKSRKTKEKIEDKLIELGWGKKSCLFAVGGGALLDLVGFVSATYCRGISYVSFPTTLLAMTDAAIGGKTGINVAEAKNWIGAFHHPKKVFIDTSLIDTLPDEVFLYGLAETIKHALIADRVLFEFIEKNAEKILQRKQCILEEMIWRSCQIKKRIVEIDPFEIQGYRHILNFGHTVGHAIETLTGYSFPHGQAVLQGMRIEAEMAHLIGFFSKASLERMKEMLHLFPFQWQYPRSLSFDMFMRDKKGPHHFVALSEIGDVAQGAGTYVFPFSKAIFERAWNNVVCNA